MLLYVIVEGKDKQHAVFCRLVYFAFGVSQLTVVIPLQYTNFGFKLCNYILVLYTS